MEECWVGEVLVLEGGRVPLQRIGLQPELAEQRRDVALCVRHGAQRRWGVLRGSVERRRRGSLRKNAARCQGAAVEQG